MFDLKGKVVLAAGGAGYLSVPACRGLVEHGAAVMIADVNRAKLEPQVRELKNAFPSAQVEGVFLEIGDEQSIREAVERTVTAFGKLDVLINATYLSVGKAVEDLSAEELDRALHLNVTGSFLLAREACGQMKNGGSIIFFSSMYGRISPDPHNYPPPILPNPIEYGVAKAALEQMVRYLAVHWAQQQIRVNGVAPGAFPHPQQQTDSPHWMKMLADRAPLARIGRQEEVAGAVLFLASDEASYVTGHILSVDGGWTIW